MRFAVNQGDVCSEEIDGEVIVINLTTGCYYSLGGSGAAIWPMATAGWNAAEIAAQFAGASPEAAAIETEVAGFLDHLCAENLLIASAGNGRVELPGLAPASGFATPAIEKFTDMQELLLVDPIHEVAEAGWPLRETGGA